MSDFREITPQDVVELVKRILKQSISSDQPLSTSSLVNHEGSCMPSSQYQNSSSYAHLFIDTQLQASQSQRWRSSNGNTMSDEEEGKRDLEPLPEQSRAKLRYSTNLLDLIE